MRHPQPANAAPAASSSGQTPDKWGAFRRTGRGQENLNFLVIQAMTFLGWLSDPFKGLSDLQLGDEKGTLNHLVVMFLLSNYCVVPNDPCKQLSIFAFPLLGPE